MLDKIIFVDRDGTLNYDENGYISKPEEFMMYPFSADSIKMFHELGYKCIVVTNQSGIARGYYSFDDLSNVHDKMSVVLDKVGTFVNDILVSPYHKDGIVVPYNVDSDTRKPGTGLLKEYFKNNNFQTSASFMIGDKRSDIELGKNFNMRTILVLTGEGKKTFYDHYLDCSVDSKPDYVVNNIFIAAKLIRDLNKIKR